MTTKTKKPSKIGPTGYWFPFLAVVSGTAPRLVMFFSNLSTFLSARRLDVVCSNECKKTKKWLTTKQPTKSITGQDKHQGTEALVFNIHPCYKYAIAAEGISFSLVVKYVWPPFLILNQGCPLQLIQQFKQPGWLIA